jgi:hypothetical protein
MGLSPVPPMSAACSHRCSYVALRDLQADTSRTAILCGHSRRVIVTMGPGAESESRELAAFRSTGPALRFSQMELRAALIARQR